MTESYSGHLTNVVPGGSGTLSAAQQVSSISEYIWPATQDERTGEGAPEPVSNESWARVQEQIRAINFEDTRSVFQEVIERATALFFLILFAPVMVALAIYIRLDSPGLPVFSHYRVGKNGRLFKFYKFRTLYADAKMRFPAWYAYRYSEDDLNRLHFKVPQDPRITRAGHFLRRSTLDELPNLWNVLKGDMALVGPRPEIPEMLQYYRPECLIKFCVKPGVTGLAQVSGRGRLLFRDTEELDAYSVNSRSIAKDLNMILQTVYLIFKMDGAF